MKDTFNIIYLVLQMFFSIFICALFLVFAVLNIKRSPDFIGVLIFPLPFILSIWLLVVAYKELREELRKWK